MKSIHFFQIIPKEFKTRFTITWVSALVIALFGAANPASALSRLDRPTSLRLASITSPFPSTFGYALGYTMTPEIQFTLGMGFLDYVDSTTQKTYPASTLGAEARIYIFRHNISPYFAFGASQIQGDVKGKAQLSVGETSATNVVYTGGLGVEWQNNAGLILGAEYKALSGDGTFSYAPGGHIGFAF